MDRSLAEQTAAQTSRIRATTTLLVGGALGLNVWATLLLVPVLHARGAGHLDSALPLWLTWLPLPLLAWGLWRLGYVVLLALFPISLALLNAAFRGPTGPGIFTVWSFGLAALSLLGYLVGMTILLEVRSQRDDARASRPLKLDPLSPKWRRRRRVYLELALCAAFIPLALIYTIDFHPETARSLRAEYQGAAQEMQVLFIVCALAFWVSLFSTFFSKTLEMHRRGDADLYLELRTLEQRARLTRPRIWFYLLIVGALLLMGLLLWLRRQGG